MTWREVMPVQYCTAAARLPHVALLSGVPSTAPRSTLVALLQSHVESSQLHSTVWDSTFVSIILISSKNGSVMPFRLSRWHVRSAISSVMVISWPEY